jgi:hypothetical protein
VHKPEILFVLLMAGVIGYGVIRDGASDQAIHRVNTDIRGCMTFDSLQALQRAADARDIAQWNKTLLMSDDCTTFHKNDRVVIEVKPAGGLIKIRREGKTVGFYTLAAAVD